MRIARQCKSDSTTALTLLLGQGGETAVREPSGRQRPRVGLAAVHGLVAATASPGTLRLPGDCHTVGSVTRESLAKPFRFYGSLVRTALGDFSNVWQALSFWVLLVVGLLGIVFQPVAQRLSLGWQSLSPAWGVGLMVAVLAFAIGRANYRHIESLERQVKQATPEPSVGAPDLTDSAVSIEQLTLPVTDPLNGSYAGQSLNLRFTNHRDTSVGLKCRLIDLGTELPNGELQEEDWFRERWLRWSDDETQVDLTPGAHRDCEVSRMYIGSAIVAPARDEALPRSLRPGIWAAVVNVEAGGFAVRRLKLRFEWKTFAPPYSPGQRLRWLETST
jgi:hypothetical protein